MAYNFEICSNNRLLLILGGEPPPTPNPWGPLDTPRSPDPSDNDYTEEWRSLYSILSHINKAIQDNDNRNWYQRLDFQTSPLPPCNVIYEDQFEEQLRLSTRMNSAFPIIAHTNIGQIVDTPFSPDFIFVSESVCNIDGIKFLNAAIQVRVSRYLLCFTELERYRDNLARVNDVFGGQAAQVAKDLVSVDRLERSKKIYQDAKANIENIINSFLGRINALHTEIRKMLQEAIARRMGMGYKRANPYSHFLMILRHRPLNIFRPTDPEQEHLPEFWIPQGGGSAPSAPGSSSRQIKRSVDNDRGNNYSCIKNINSLDQLAWAITTRTNESVQIYAFRENINILNLQITHLRNVFHSWLYTSKGWYNSYYYADQYNSVLSLFERFEHSILRNESCSTVPIKKAVINNFIYHVLTPEMTTSLKWYYEPMGSIKRVRDYMHDNIDTLQHQPNTMDLQVPQF